MKVDEPSVQIRVGDPVSAGALTVHGSGSPTVRSRRDSCTDVAWFDSGSTRLANSYLEGQNRRSWCRDCSHVIAGSSRVGTTVMTRVLDRIEP